MNKIVPYLSEQDLEDILRCYKIDVHIPGDSDHDKTITGSDFCEETGIELNCNLRF